MRSILAIGLMSGTSMDGIDAVLVRATYRSAWPTIRLLAFQAYNFSPALHRELLRIVRDGASSLSALSQLHGALGEAFASAARRISRKAKVSLDRIPVIGSHGQTVWHEPLKRSFGGMRIRSTLQVGDPAVIAARTGVTTVGDFRPADVARGGQGAPLSAWFHYLLMRNRRQAVSVHNLGGISNLTYIPPRARPEEVIAFDTGPGNMLIDGIVQKGSRGRLTHDAGGRLAASGRVDLHLAAELLRHPFIMAPPPKTTGRELFGAALVDRIWRRHHRRLALEDLVATATAFTASAIAENYRRFVLKRGPLAEIVFCGGGAHNRTLLRMIGRELGGIRLSRLDDYGIPADAAEAVCFAVLGAQAVLGLPNHLPRTTGAREPAILGKIVPGRNYHGLKIA